MSKPAPATPVLIARRKAAATLNNFVLNVLGMGTMAEKFIGDRDNDWAAIDQSEIRALKNGKLVAVVELHNDERATLVIPDARLLANRKHQYDFKPREYGFGPQPMNWRKEKEPYQVSVEIPQDIPGLLKRQKPQRRSPMHRDPYEMERML